MSTDSVVLLDLKESASCHSSTERDALTLEICGRTFPVVFHTVDKQVLFKSQNVWQHYVVWSKLCKVQNSFCFRDTDGKSTNTHRHYSPLGDSELFEQT